MTPLRSNQVNETLTGSRPRSASTDRQLVHDSYPPPFTMSRPKGEKLTAVEISDSMTTQPVRAKTLPLKYLALCFCALLVGWTAAGFPAGSNLLSYLSIFKFTNRYYVSMHSHPLIPWEPGSLLYIPVGPWTEAVSPSYIRPAHINKSLTVVVSCSRSHGCCSQVSRQEVLRPSH